MLDMADVKLANFSSIISSLGLSCDSVFVSGADALHTEGLGRHSCILSAMVARSSNVCGEPEADRIAVVVAGNCLNQSCFKIESSIFKLPISDRMCRRSWEGVRSPSTTPDKSCWSRRPSEAVVRSIKACLSTS